MNTASPPRKGSPLIWLIPLLAVSALSLGIWSAYQSLGRVPELATPTTKSATLIPNPRPLKPFSLTDHAGNLFSTAQLRDHWTFFSFGYTSCPDVCPATLTILNQAAALLKETDPRNEPRFVFVSVDPERDSLDRLATYLSYFNPEFIGITGPESALQQLTGQLGVLYRKVENGDTALGYLMDHSASLILADPEGRLSAVFGVPHDASAIAQDFQLIRRQYNR